MTRTATTFDSERARAAALRRHAEERAVKANPTYAAERNRKALLKRIQALLASSTFDASTVADWQVQDLVLIRAALIDQLYTQATTAAEELKPAEIVATLKLIGTPETSTEGPSRRDLARKAYVDAGLEPPAYLR